MDGCRVHDCSGSAGISARDNAIISNCVVYGNSVNFGILTGFASVLTNCSATVNLGVDSVSAGIKTGSSSTLTRCVSTGNTSDAAGTSSTGAGFVVGSESKIRDCVASGNRGDGIRINAGTLAVGNTADGNVIAGDGAGIHALGAGSRIEANNVKTNDRGIDVDNAGNIIIKNTARGNGSSGAGNFDIVADNDYGAIVDATGANAAAVGKGPFASTLASTDPWANISY